MNRFVLLGASNLTRSFRSVTRLATMAWGPGPWSILAAAGHGRAYGVWSQVGLRSLPPIADCGLWRALAGQPAAPTRAILADAGNDLALGASPAEAATAIGRCLERLRTAGAETVLTLPPEASVARLPAWRFVLLRSLMFPGRGFTQSAILTQLRELSRRLSELAAKLGAEAVELEAEWYGSDGIHLSRSRRRDAWSSVLDRWPTAPVRSEPLPRAFRWNFLRAEEARLLAMRLGRPQPARRLADGSTLALF